MRGPQARSLWRALAAALAAAWAIGGWQAVGAEPALPATPRPLTVEALSVTLEPSPEALLSYVRDEVGIELYAGSLRGPLGTLWSGAGNSLDKSSLLVSLLRRAGFLCRYAQGQLPPEKAAALIDGLWDTGLKPLDPPRGSDADGSTPAPYDPAKDQALLRDASEHFWVQCWDGDAWVDLDPSFADSQVGSAFCPASRTFHSVPDELRYRLRASVWLSLSDEAGGSRETCAARLVVYADEATGKPVTLKQVVKKSEDGTKLLTLRPCLWDGNRLVVGRDLCAQLDADGQGVAPERILSQRLQLQCIPPRGEVLTFSSMLPRDFSGAHEVTVLFSCSRVPPEAAEAAMRASGGDDGPPALRRPSRGEGLALAWASASGEAAKSVGQRLHVVGYRASPQAVLLEACPQYQAARLRSCWDERRTVGPRGTDPRVFPTYRALSSFGDAVTRSRLMERVTGKSPAEPLAMLCRAKRDGVALQALQGDEGRQRLERLSVDANTREAMREALDRGQVVVTTGEPAEGQPPGRQPWLAVEPTTGALTPYLGPDRNSAVCLEVPLRRPEPDPRREILKGVMRGLTAYAIVVHAEMSVHHAFNDIESLVSLSTDAWKGIADDVKKEFILGLARLMLDWVALEHVLHNVHDFETGAMEGDLRDFFEILKWIAGIGILRFGTFIL
jgi:hypothetical protein